MSQPKSILIVIVKGATAAAPAAATGCGGIITAAGLAMLFVCLVGAMFLTNPANQESIQQFLLFVVFPFVVIGGFLLVVVIVLLSKPEKTKQ
ncbi:MAG TPA: hypothetical protein VLI92_02265 [Candidatus Saccharimonadales bacterium]|nr:hypothetical protein [Candidatus Saccharimonadales bacterium]